VEHLESWSKIIAAVAIPIVIAIGGWVIQDTVSRQGTNKDYVNLALQILQKETKTEEERRMRNWAVDLINASSPVKFDSETTQLLKAGTINLARFNASLRMSIGGGLAISPDSRLVAVGTRDNATTVFEIGTRKQVGPQYLGNTDYVYSIAFSPDAHFLLSGSSDCTARIFEISSGRQLRVIERSTEVIGVGYSQDGKNLVLRDRHSISIFYSRDGRLLTSVPETE